MEPITAVALQQFLKKLGEQFTHPAKFYLLGGSALCLLGSPRETLDVDYSLEPASISEGGGKGEIEQILKQLSSELRLDLELVPLAEFIPLEFAGRAGGRLPRRGRAVPGAARTFSDFSLVPAPVDHRNGRALDFPGRSRRRAWHRLL